MKSSTKSVLVRELGNAAFKRRDYDTALECYTAAISLAPQSSTDLVFSLANRSLVLMKMKLYSECLVDINRAKGSCESEISDVLVQKLAQRRQFCLDNLKRFAGVNDISYSNAHEELGSRMTIDRAKFYDIPAFSPIVNPIKIGAALPSADAERSHPYHVILSPCVVVQHSPARGRYVVAKDRIPSGTLILTESAFAWIPLPAELDRHCWTCLRLLPANPIPCNDCSDVRYCDESCRSDEWSSSIHQFECGHVLGLINAGLMHLALRTVLSCLLLLEHRVVKVESSSAVASDLTDNLNRDRVTQILNCLVDDTDLYYPTIIDASYRVERGMCALQFHRMSPEVVGAKEAMRDSVADTLGPIPIPERFRVLLQWCVDEGSDFLGGAISNEKGCTSGCAKLCPLQDLLARLVLKHSLKLIVNATQITDPNPKTEPDADGTHKSIGTGVYPIQCLLNHSCRPNIQIKYLGTTLVMTAKEDIPAGAELNNCYGPQEGQGVGVAERRKELDEQYNFLCECDACLEETGK